MPNPFQSGVCYYPEHTSAARHPDDIQRIADAGFEVVRLAEGAWSYFEPTEGTFQFDLFDRVIDLCRRHGLRVIMGTPTYTAPAWVAANYPQVLRWNFNRIPMAHGSRRNLNYTSEKYFQLSDRLCTALAEHYADEPLIFAWQLDNEFNCHMDASYAPTDEVAFRAWVRAKYKTLHALNRAWGTAFWSQTYTRWEQIHLPHPSATYLNPSVLLDESRFISDCVVRFAARQAAILRTHNPDWQMTHNGIFNNINAPDLARILDFFSHDQYPLFYPQDQWPQTNWGLIQARSLSFPFAILEQQSGPGGQMDYLHRTPRPGQIRLWAHQSIAHGANLICYFRWRTCPYGSEQHWHGLIDQDNRDTSRLAEAAQVAAEGRQLPASLLSAAPQQRVALVRQYDSEINERRIDTYIKDGAWEIARWRDILCRRHIPVDFVWPNDAWNGYPLVIAPHLKIVDPPLVQRMTSYVRAGGTLVLGAQSGLKNPDNHIVQAPAPGLLRALAGIEVDQWTALDPDEHPTLQLLTGQRLTALSFAETLRPIARRVEVLAHWTAGDTLLAQAPAITRHRVGKGAVYYLGFYAPHAAIPLLVDLLANEVDLSPLAGAPPEVEIIARHGKTHRYLYLLNHAPSTQRITQLPAAIDLLTRQRIRNGTLELPPYGVALLQAPRASARRPRSPSPRPRP